MSNLERINRIGYLAAGLRGFGLKSALAALLCGSFVLCTHTANANISISAEADRDPVMLGEQFELLVTVRHDDGYTVCEPDVGKALGDFVVVKSSKQEGKEGAPTVEFRYTLAGFKLDRATIASVVIEYTDPGSRPGKLATDPIGLTIVGTVPEGETETKDIRGMIEIEPRMALWLKVLLCVVALALAAAIGWWRISRRRRLKAGEPAQKPLPPSVVALAELERLVKGDLLFQKRYKEFYFALSEIIRRFLSRRLGFWAEDMTTTEIEFAMRDDPISREFASTTLEVLRFSDLVKFAKLIPSDAKTDEIIEKARYLIELGREPLFETDTEPMSAVSLSEDDRGEGVNIAE